MGWSTSDIPEQSGRTAVVTGANGGLGLVTARELAAKGAHVVMAVRNQQKAAAAVEEIRAAVPDASLELVALDLSAQESVRTAAAQILDTHGSIDLLINNAGVMAISEARTVDGFEMQFGVDHLGHWSLTALLLPALLRTPGSRVVTVTSTAHHMGRAVDVDNPHLDGRYGAWRAYGQAKLANFHFGLGLQRELTRAGALTTSLIAHPGLSDTDLQSVSVAGSGGGVTQRFAHAMTRRTGMSAADGALPQLRAATDPAAKGGEFYGPLFVNNGAPVRKPVLRRLGMNQAIAKLWAVSERETGIALDVSTPAGA
ncbi:SDR family NAD(P)-dependent oxidoreductase [Kribbella sandramycini]|uniref:NAD(P)-dependent dehydrogenase (Short-subunit alcohol dehydrogenase family) n=1 Tax=Kribbella sandramycini TaxID=60450 RepID=A0A7Y4L5T0_9ACTN|nr:oxidoreductase [Kribbella sandramycini]MBB6570682.1 NAD(P)-dependent dehydrogenase (short-subunit alcohol dehydrogenase family) [Kribbella sandramycini]NOL43826.1 SDR family NAD(P)-dependent oxidoreductase [Kribbella sandramycini]